MIQDTDMPLEMQLQAMSSASEALDLFDVSDFRSVAAHIKKEFDMIYGSGWQYVCGGFKLRLLLYPYTRDLYLLQFGIPHLSESFRLA